MIGAGAPLPGVVVVLQFRRVGEHFVQVFHPSRQFKICFVVDARDVGPRARVVLVQTALRDPDEDRVVPRRRLGTVHPVAREVVLGQQVNRFLEVVFWPDTGAVELELEVLRPRQG